MLRGTISLSTVQANAISQATVAEIAKVTRNI